MNVPAPSVAQAPDARSSRVFHGRKWYVLSGMGPLKTRSMRLVLLLLLMLPVQSFARINCDSHQHCGESTQYHHCGSCCLAAVAASPIRLTPPSFINSGISMPAYLPWLTVAPDRAAMEISKWAACSPS